MTDTTTEVREHCSPTDLTGRIKSALATITPQEETFTVAQLAPLGQFHTRGILATAELASAAGLKPSTIIPLVGGSNPSGPTRDPCTGFHLLDWFTQRSLFLRDSSLAPMIGHVYICFCRNV